MKTFLSAKAFASMAIMLQGISASQYLIDPVSCAGAKGDFVDKAIQGAFAMAAAGLSGAANTPSAAQTQLGQWLLGATPDKSKIASTFSVSGGVGRFNHKAAAGATLGTDDLKIYCDQSRIKLRPAASITPWKYFDTDIQMATGKTTTWLCSKNPKLILAYTTHPTGKHWQIQLCDYFVTHGMAVDYPTTHQLPAGTMKTPAAVKIIPAVANKLYTPIDYFSLSDKVMLHELTHALKENPMIDAGITSGYGWKNCRALVTGNKSPMTNADTWALYGSVSLMMKDCIGSVDATGQINILKALGEE